MSFKLYFTVPVEHKQRCLDAVFAAGAGRYGELYEQVAFEVAGTGQFMPVCTSRQIASLVS